MYEVGLLQRPSSVGFSPLLLLYALVKVINVTVKASRQGYACRIKDTLGNSMKEVEQSNAYYNFFLNQFDIQVFLLYSGFCFSLHTAYYVCSMY